MILSRFVALSVSLIQKVSLLQIAYNLDIVPRGDDYLKGVAPMAEAFPWMMGPGNHEADCNYTYQNYRMRFVAQNHTRSPGGPPSGSSRYFSFELGPVHFLMFDTDAYGFDEVAYMLRDQFEWIEADLMAVNRSRTPWIVLMSHRPMYCSPSSVDSGADLGWPKQPDGEAIGPEPAGYGEGFATQGLLAPAWDPTADVYQQRGDELTIPSCGIGDLIRNGMVRKDGTGRDFAIEPLMEKHKVDMYLCGHMHNFERLFPVLNGSFTPNVRLILLCIWAGLRCSAKSSPTPFARRGRS